MSDNELPQDGASSDDPWINSFDELAHPDAPFGSGGHGFFKDARPLIRDVENYPSVAHPESPRGRLLALDGKHEADVIWLRGSKAKGKLGAKRPAAMPPAPAHPAPKQQPPMPTNQDGVNARVKKEVDDLVGKPVVGDGECFALADAVLKKSAAKSAGDFGAVAKEADYKWGTELKDWTDVKPGDILQFRNHKVTITTIKKTSRKYDNGTTQVEPGIDKAVVVRQRPHHTAIVSAKNGNDTVAIVEQHVIDPNTRALSSVVRQNELPLGRSVKTLPKQSSRHKDENGKYTEEEETTITTEITGTVWRFRPQAK